MTKSKSVRVRSVTIEIRNGILHVDHVNYRPRDAIDVYSDSDSQWHNAIFEALEWHCNPMDRPRVSTCDTPFSSHGLWRFIPIHCSGMCNAWPRQELVPPITARSPCVFRRAAQCLAAPRHEAPMVSHVQQSHAMTDDEFWSSACHGRAYRDVFFSKTDTKPVAKWTRGIVLLLHGCFGPAMSRTTLKACLGISMAMALRSRTTPRAVFRVRRSGRQADAIDRTLVANARNYSLDLACSPA